MLQQQGLRLLESIAYRLDLSLSGPGTSSETWSLAPDRYVPEDQDLPAHVEVDLVGKLEELYQYVRVLRLGADRVLLGAVVQYELVRELAWPAALLLAPVGVQVGDLTHHDALFGVLFSHSCPPVIPSVSLAQGDVVGD